MTIPMPAKAKCPRCGHAATPDPRVERLEAALDELSKDAAVRRARPDHDQWVAVGLDLAVHRLRALLRSPQERSE